MSTFAASANMVARVTVQSTGASYHIEFTDPPKHGDCWTIGSAPTADIDFQIGHETPGISGKHLGLAFDQDGMVIVKIFSSRGTSLTYESETVEGTVHDCIGENSPRAPFWAVPVGQRVHLLLGRQPHALHLTIEAFDHAQHLDEYLAAIDCLKASASKTAEPLQPTEEPSPCPRPPPPTPAPGVATFMSGALRDMELATPVAPGSTTMMPSLAKTAFDKGKYTHSFLKVDPTSYQTGSGCRTVFKAHHTKTWKVYAAKNFDKSKKRLLSEQTTILTAAKDKKAPHIITHFETFLVPRSIMRYMLLTEWCELGSMVEEGRRRPFTYHESCMIVEQIAKALMYLHEQRFVHRDVRPRHILVRSRTISHLDVCLTDFSSSTKIPTATQASNEHYSLRGQRRAENEAYIAPDAFASSPQLREEHIRNLAAVDIWSLGVIALELLTGSLPTIIYETAQDMQHPILVSGQQFTKALVDHRDKMAMTPAAAANDELVPLIMEMLQPSPYCRITAQELAGGMVIVVTLMEDESRMKYCRTKYPGGQFPAVAAPRVHAYDLWRGVS